MTPDRWQRICALFHEVRQCDPAGRETAAARRLRRGSRSPRRGRAPARRRPRRQPRRLPRRPHRIGHAHRPDPRAARRPRRALQAPPADRRGRHGRRLHGRAGPSPSAAGSRSRSSSRAWTPTQVIARFEAERQALALMDHPNIARVLDAGTTDTGRPYFVMELVKGVPITEYCDEQPARRPRSGWSCSSPVCQAIQHAHQKGIIHRDIKPSNVLVTLVRRQAGAQGDRLRRGQGDRPAADRADAVHPVRRDRRHARVHEPRAGRADRRSTSTRAATSTRWACCSTSC